MLTTYVQQRLQANWGDKAESMDCRVEAVLCDYCSGWRCYLYAQNPEDPDEFKAILKGYGVQTAEVYMSSLVTMYNREGEPLQVDYEFRPRKASILFKQLQQEAS